MQENRITAHFYVKITPVKIAIVKLSSLGDIIHALICCQWIEKAITGAEIHWIIDKRFREVVQYNPCIRKIHSLDFKAGLLPLLGQLQEIKKNSFDIVIDMQGLIKSALVSWKTGSNRHGFSFTSAREGVASFFYNRCYKIDYRENIIIRNLKLACMSLDFPFSLDQIKNRKPCLFFTPRQLEKAQSLLTPYAAKHIMLIPGVSTREREIGPRVYAEIINNIKAAFYLIWGNEKELTICRRIKKKAPAVKIMPRLTFNELTAFCSCCNLSFGPDTGPANIMFALNKKSLTVYWQKARNSAVRNTYVSDANRTLTFADLHNINTAAVIEQLQKLLVS